MKKKTRKMIEAHLRTYNKNLKEDEDWNNIIRSRLKQMSKDEIGLVEMRYFKRKKINYITYELYMSRNKYFSMIDNILTEIALDAAYQHLLKRQEQKQ